MAETVSIVNSQASVFVSSKLYTHPDMCNMPGNSCVVCRRGAYASLLQVVMSASPGSNEDFGSQFVHECVLDREAADHNSKVAPQYSMRDQQCCSQASISLPISCVASVEWSSSVLASFPCTFVCLYLCFTALVKAVSVSVSKVRFGVIFVKHPSGPW